MGRRIAVLPLMLLLALALAVGAEAQACGVDVYHPGVSDDVMFAEMKNTGNTTQSINFTFYVNYDSVSAGNITLNASGSANGTDTGRITGTYDFSPGHYAINITVMAACGESDSVSMGYIVLGEEPGDCSNPSGSHGQLRCDLAARELIQCVDGQWEYYTPDIWGYEYCDICTHCGDGILNCGETPETCPEDYPITPVCEISYLDTYRCYNNVLQREYKFSNCSVQWVNYQYCTYGCENNECVRESTTGCGVMIKEFEYSDSITEYESAYVASVIKNTGNRLEEITLSLYIDSSLENSYTFHLNEWDEARKRFTFFPPSGLHRIELRADTDCGIFKTRHADINVREFQVPPPQPPGPEPPAAVETSVKVYPTHLDVPLYKGKSMSVEITSEPRKFNITVLGISSGWLNYPSQVDVSGRQVFYIYVTPQRLGRYNMTVSVTGDKTFTQDIDMYVVPEGEAAPGLAWPDMTGFREFLADNRVAIILAVTAIALVLALLIAFMRLER